jgi:hypothetical protein
MRQTVGLALALFVLATGAGCQRDGAGGDGARTGSMRARLVTDAGDDVVAVQVDVLAGGATVDSQIITNLGLLVGGTTGQPGQRGGDAFFVLRPGSYVVKATPLAAGGVPSATCSSAEVNAVVTAGQTTELVLAMFCADPGTGGLDVTVTTEHPPVITDLSFDPSKFVRTCQPVIIRVTASDADHQTLTYAWQLTQAPPGARALLVPHVAVAGFISETSGSFAVRVSVSDPGGHTAALEVPVHVVPGPAVQCLPDGVVVVGQTGPKVGVLPTNSFPPKGTGAVRPGLGEVPKEGVSDVTLVSSETVRQRYGVLAKNLPVAVAPATTPKPARVVSYAGSFQRARFLLGPSGVSLQSLRSVPEGRLLGDPVLRGRILAVARTANEVRFLATGADPTVSWGFPSEDGQGHSLFTGGTGSLAVSMPAGLINSDSAASLTLQFYRMAGTVPSDTPVVVAALPTLLAGAELIGTISGDQLATFLQGGIR